MKTIVGSLSAIAYTVAAYTCGQDSCAQFPCAVNTGGAPAGKLLCSRSSTSEYCFSSGHAAKNSLYGSCGSFLEFDPAAGGCNWPGKANRAACVFGDENDEETTTAPGLEVTTTVAVTTGDTTTTAEITTEAATTTTIADATTTLATTSVEVSTAAETTATTETTTTTEATTEATTTTTTTTEAATTTTTTTEATTGTTTTEATTTTTSELCTNACEPWQQCVVDDNSVVICNELDFCGADLAIGLPQSDNLELINSQLASLGEQPLFEYEWTGQPSYSSSGDPVAYPDLKVYIYKPTYTLVQVCHEITSNDALMLDQLFGSGSTNCFAQWADQEVIDLDVRIERIAKDAFKNMGYCANGNGACGHDPQTGAVIDDLALSSSVSSFDSDLFVNDNGQIVRSLGRLMLPESISEWPVTGWAEGLNGLTTFTMWEAQFSGALPADAFLGMDSLTTLDLAGNRFSSIEAGAFNGLSQVTYIYLNRNEFVTVGAGFFNGLDAVAEIDFTSSMIETIEDGAFDDVLDTLSTVIMFGNPIMATQFHIGQPYESIIQTSGWGSDCTKGVDCC